MIIHITNEIIKLNQISMHYGCHILQNLKGSELTRVRFGKDFHECAASSILFAWVSTDCFLGYVVGYPANSITII